MKLKRLNQLKTKVKSTEYFASNGLQEVDEAHLDQISDGLKTPAVLTLDSCDIKPGSLLRLTRVKTPPKIQGFVCFSRNRNECKASSKA